MALSENRKKFEELIKNWIMLEENTITTANDLMGQSNNPMLKTMIDLVKMDSEKHKRILETIRLSLNSAYAFSTDDLKVVDSFIEKHAEMEKNAVKTAEQALEMGSLPIPKLLLSHLLEDEKSHDNYMEELTKIKAHMAKDT
jgi:rubrerythrin